MATGILPPGHILVPKRQQQLPCSRKSSLRPVQCRGTAAAHGWAFFPAPQQPKQALPAIAREESGTRRGKVAGDRGSRRWGARATGTEVVDIPFPSTTKLPEIKFTKLFINGQFVDAVSGKTFEKLDPRTSEAIVSVAEGDKADIDLAVKAAREAFDHGPWPRMSGYERGRILWRLADLMEQHADELAMLDSLESGKLITLSKMVTQLCISLFRYYAGAADKIHGETVKMEAGYQAYTLKEPAGVAGLIIPWNFPNNNFTMKVAPALAAGCTAVLKPAEQTPLSALYLAHLAKEAGVPDGVLNVVNGYGKTAGAALSSHMDVDLVAFTGSTETGRAIMEAAARSNLKPVFLELGGKSPLVIFDDADVDMAVELSHQAIFVNQGETCAAGSRVLVQEGIYDEFLKKASARVRAVKIGDPFDPQVSHGPQVDKMQFEKVLSYIEHGKREGATLVAGGKPSGDKGYYVEPTIFSDVQDDMLIARDEIFGPVLCVMKFKTVEEAIQRANNTRYGLAAGIVTKDVNVVNMVSRSIKAGTVWINCYFTLGNDCPFGGVKTSGFGKDHGMDALENYLIKKAIVTPIFGSPWH